QWVFPDIDAGFPILKICVAERGVQPGVVPDKRKSVPQELDGVIDRVAPPPPRFVARPEIALIRVPVRDGTIGQPPLFIGGESALEGVDDDTGKTLLNSEDVFDGAVELVGP